MKIVKKLTLESFNNKLHNQLSEDAKANAEIRMVAKYIAEFLFNYGFSITTEYTNIVKSQNQDEPTITDPALKELLNNLGFGYQYPIDDAQKNSRGIYYPSQYRIYLNRDILTTEQELTSTLIHELRHALDDFKSNYSYKWIDKKLTQIQDPSQDPTTYAEYIKLSHEINARFSQVLLDIANDLDITRSNLRDKIIEYLTKHQITLKTLNAENDPKYKKASDRYKKLYGKAASFWQAYEKIKTQPQTQIGIPAIPKTAKTVSSNITKKPGFIQRVKDIAKNTVTGIFNKD